MSIDEGRPEYTPETDREWRQLLDASAQLDRVLAEYIQLGAKVGADDDDVMRAACIVQARGIAAVADALHSIRQELTLTNNHLLKIAGRA